jgi:hypothetical protein
MKVPYEKGVAPLGLESCAEIARYSAKREGDRRKTAHFAYRPCFYGRRPRRRFAIGYWNGNTAIRGNTAMSFMILLGAVSAAVCLVRQSPLNNRNVRRSTRLTS